MVLHSIRGPDALNVVTGGRGCDRLRAMMTSPTVLHERRLAARICLADPEPGGTAVVLRCPGPHREDDAWFEHGTTDQVTLHCDGLKVWASHSASTCGRKLEFDGISVELFDRYYAQASVPVVDVLPDRILHEEVCLPRLLGLVEHEHTVGRVPEISRYHYDLVGDAGGHSYVERCPSCASKQGFAAEFDIHRTRIWCGTCGHSWTQLYGGDTYTPLMVEPRTVRGEHTARGLALELLAAEAR